MKKLIFILLILSAFIFNTNAQERSFPRFTYGAEWSYTATIHSIWHYNFFSPDGYRVDLKGNEMMYCSNGEAYVNAGYNFNENWNLSLYIGIAGVGNLHKAVPVSFRSTYLFGNTPYDDRWFTFAEAGSGLSLKVPPQEIFSCKVGGGYRISLSRNTKIDFLMAVKVTYDHPDITYDDVKIDLNRINRNSISLTSISVGMAINI